MKITIDWFSLATFSIFTSFLHSYCRLVLIWSVVSWLLLIGQFVSPANDRLIKCNLSYDFRVFFFFISFYGKFMTHMTSDIQQMMIFDMFEHSYTDREMWISPTVLTIVSRLI